MLGDFVDGTAVGVDNDVGGVFVGRGTQYGQALERGRSAVEQQRTAGVVPHPRTEHVGRCLQPHHQPGITQARAVRGVEHRTPSARDHERFRRRARIGDCASFELAEMRFTLAGEDLGHGHAGGGADELVGVDERAIEQVRAPLPHRGLPRAHEPHEHEVPRAHSFPRARLHGRQTRCGRDAASEAMYAAWLRVNSASESPPNLRIDSDASTRATIVSATTPDAGTAVTSVRSLNDTVSSLVAVSTVRSTGRLRVASGFIATRATSTRRWSSRLRCPRVVPRV